MMPEGWSQVSLSEILKLLESGKRPKGGVKDIIEGIPSLGGEHLNSLGGFKFEKIKYVPHNFAQKLNKVKLYQEDILIVKDGATTGKTSFVDANFPFDDAVINEHLFLCRVCSEIKSKLIFYFLYSQVGNQQILLDFRGAAQGGISKAFTDKVEIPLPPLNEQKRIVAKIEALQERSQRVKTELDAIKPLLDQFRQSVLAAAFRGDLTADWRENNPDVEPAEVLLEKIRVERRCRWEEAELEKMKAQGKTPKDDKWKDKYKEPESIDIDNLSELPDGWCWVSIDEVSELVTDGDHNPPKKANRVLKGIAHITVKNIINGKLIEDDCTYITEQDFERTRKRYTPKGGDVIIT